MSYDFRRFQAGDHLKFSVRTANEIVASAEDYARKVLTPGAEDPPEYVFAGNVIQVRNDSGSPMQRFSVAGLNGALITEAQNLQEFQNYPRFSVVAPVVPLHTDNFCILVEPLQPGAIGLAMISGICACQVLVGPCGPPTWVGPLSGQPGYLVGGAGGAKVLYCGTAGGSPTGSSAGASNNLASNLQQSLSSLGSSGSNSSIVWAYVRLPEFPSTLPRAILTSNLINCHAGTAQWVTFSATGQLQFGATISVIDVLGVMLGNYLCELNATTGNYYMPAGAYAYLQPVPLADTPCANGVCSSGSGSSGGTSGGSGGTAVNPCGCYEVVNYGGGCLCPSSSGGSGKSGGSGSGLSGHSGGSGSGPLSGASGGGSIPSGGCPPGAPSQVPGGSGSGSGACAGWVYFLDCNNNPHYYWGN